MENCMIEEPDLWNDYEPEPPEIEDDWWAMPMDLEDQIREDEQHMARELRDKVDFQPNIAQDVILSSRFSAPKEIDSVYGGKSYLYSTEDNRVFFATPDLFERISELRPRPGETIRIQKRVFDKNNTKWFVTRVEAQQPGKTFEGSAPAAAVSTPLTSEHGEHGQQNSVNAITQPARQPQPIDIGQGRKLPVYTQLLAEAYIAAIDAIEMARQYGSSKSLVFKFSEESVQASANTIFIQACRERESQARAAGGAR